MCVSSCTRERQSHLPGHHRGFLQARRTASQSVPFFILQMSAPHLHGQRACLGTHSAFGQGSRYVQGCDPTLDNRGDQLSVRLRKSCLHSQGWWADEAALNRPQQAGTGGLAPAPRPKQSCRGGLWHAMGSHREHAE